MKITKNGLITGLINAVLGLLIAVGPHTLFAVCEAMDGKYMKCHWTALAESGAGGIAAVLGLYLIFSCSVQTRKGVQLSLLPVYIVSVLIPDVLTGVCGGEHMICRSLTLPLLNILGFAGVAAGAVNLVYLIKGKEKQDEKE